MNTAAARRAPISRPERRRGQRPLLTVVPVSAPPRRNFGAMVTLALVLLAIIFAPMVINTQMAAVSYRMQSAQVELNKLNEKNQDLQSRLDSAQSAAALDARARQIGMVPGGKLGQVTLSTGLITGGTPAR